MGVDVVNPSGIYKPSTYFQASICVGSRLVCLSGQAGVDEQGNLVGPGDWSPTKMEFLLSGATRAATDLGFDFRRPLTLVSVTGLARAEWLVEVEATAILP